MLRLMGRKGVRRVVDGIDLVQRDEMRAVRYIGGCMAILRPCWLLTQSKRLPS
jgi:hypothetical protein